jgi:hypothetical protein
MVDRQGLQGGADVEGDDLQREKEREKHTHTL